MKRLVLGITVLFCFNLVIPTGVQATSNLLVPATNQADMPSSAVERAITLPRGWAEITLGLERLETNEVYDSQGELLDLVDDELGFKGFRMVDYIVDLRFRWGLSRNVTLGFELPFLVNRNYEDHDTGRSFEGGDLADGSFWATWQLYHRDTEDWMSSLGLRFKAFMPSGNDSPGQTPTRRQENPNQPPGYELPLIMPFLTPQINSRGVMGFSLAALAKQQLQFFSCQVEAGYIYWWPEDAVDLLPTGITSPVVEYGDWGEVFLNGEVLINLNDFLETALGLEDHAGDIVTFLFFPISLPIKWIWPGNAMASKVIVGAEAEFNYLDGIKVGVRGHEGPIEEVLTWWPEDVGTEIWALNVMPKLLWQINDHWDIGFKYYFAVDGRNTRALFPLTAVPREGSFKADIAYRF